MLWGAGGGGGEGISPILYVKTARGEEEEGSCSTSDEFGFQRESSEEAGLI